MGSNPNGITKQNRLRIGELPDPQAFISAGPAQVQERTRRTQPSRHTARRLRNGRVRRAAEGCRIRDSCVFAIFFIACLHKSPERNSEISQTPYEKDIEETFPEKSSSRIGCIGRVARTALMRRIGRRQPENPEARPARGPVRRRDRRRRPCGIHRGDRGGTARREDSDRRAIRLLRRDGHDRIRRADQRIRTQKRTGHRRNPLGVRQAIGVDGRRFHRMAQGEHRFRRRTLQTLLSADDPGSRRGHVHALGDARLRNGGEEDRNGD